MKKLKIFLVIACMISAAQDFAQGTFGTRPHTIICLGDSLTDRNMNMGPEYTAWTEGLRQALEAVGAKVQVRDLAQAGAKTGGTQAKADLNRMSPFLPQLYPPFTSIPDIVILYSGTNDAEPITVGACTWSGGTVTISSTGHGFGVGDQIYVSGFDQTSVCGWQTIVSASTNAYTYAAAGGGSLTATGSGGVAWASLDTTTFQRGLIRWCQFGCKGYVNSQASLPIDGVEGDRFVVLYDTSSTGGTNRPTGNYNALGQITGAITDHVVGNSEPTVWEYRSGQNGAATGGGEASWCRIARYNTTPTHCRRFIVVEQHYLNYSSGGDTQSLQFYLSSSAVPGGVRYMEAATVSAESNSNVVLANAYGYFYNLIANGYETQGSFTWHRQNNDVHFSELGDSYMKDLMFSTIINQPGWLPSISM